MWSRVPIVRLILPYIVGILLSDKFGGFITLPFYGLCLLGMALILGAFLYGMLFSYGSRWVFGLFIIMFMMAAAYFQQQKMKISERSLLDDIPDDTCIYAGTIKEAFELRERSTRGLVSLTAVKDSSGLLHPLECNIMLYTETDSALPLLKPGHDIIIKAWLRPTRPPANPAEFDYKKYLSRNEIYLTSYLSKGHWWICDGNDEFDLMNYASGIRQRLLDKLRAHGIHDRWYAVSAALLLGDDSHLAVDIREMYARAGAMHVLCVSGLHVGVIYLVLTLLLSFLKQFRTGRLLLPFLLMASIWSYAFITGLAPPVTRASFMISFIIIGNALRRYRNVYNTLATSALLMLMLNPQVLFGAGFQLSYAAVLGIVFLQKPINNLFYFRYKLPDRIWSITAVSIAAQLGTLPIILFYFHQFPVYSLLTNLAVIPLSSLIIYAGVLFFALPSLSQAAVVAAHLLKFLIRIMEMGVSIVERLPYATVSGISIDAASVVLFYLITLMACMFLLNKSGRYLLSGLFFALVFSVYHFMSDYKIEQQEQLVVYSVPAYSACGVINGREHIFYADSALWHDKEKMNYSILPHWLDRGLNEPQLAVLPPLMDVHSEKGCLTRLNASRVRVVIWQGALPACRPPQQKLKPDLLILRGNITFHASSLMKWFDPGMIILDSSVPWWKAAQIKSEIGPIEIWDVREHGAWVNSKF